MLLESLRFLKLAEKIVTSLTSNSIRIIFQLTIMTLRLSWNYEFSRKKSVPEKLIYNIVISLKPVSHQYH